MAGIGFFAPLPLALMMPFMAGQSMLMGDAFGKAYQYGKRKISAMSNEEFNKLTATQLGQEIATDYTEMIPSLQTAIKQSSAFQSMIIQELAKIIRSVPTDIISGITGNQELGNTLQTNLQSNITGGADILQSITNFFNSLSNAVPEAQASSGTISESNLTIVNTEENFSGSELASAENELAFRKAQEEKRLKELASIPSAKTLAAADDPEYLAWIKKLGRLKASFQSEQNIYRVHQTNVNQFKASSDPSGKLQIASRQKAADKAWNRMFQWQTQIRKMSQDYRHPNNNIRENALRLRRNISQWERKRI